MLLYIQGFYLEEEHNRVTIQRAKCSKEYIKDMDKNKKQQVSSCCFSCRFLFTYWVQPSKVPVGKDEIEKNKKSVGGTAEEPVTSVEEAVSALAESKCLQMGRATLRHEQSSQGIINGDSVTEGLSVWLVE